jgi:riboflavin synthase
MFTGLIEEVGAVRRLERGPAGGRLSVRAKVVLDGTKIGDSIAVGGACLTVIALDNEGFVVECMPETLARTTIGAAGPGSLVNLERSLRWGDRLGGHLVLGHVDGVGEVLRVRRAGIAWEVRLSLPLELRGAVAAKGSIAIDGISLTVMAVDEESFEVGIIPHTLKETTLRAVKAGTRVNLEADVLARYVLQSLQALAGGGTPGSAGAGRPGASGGAAAGAGAPGATGGLTEEFLRERGFA